MFEGCGQKLLERYKENSLAIREVEMKTTLRSHFTPVRMAVINNTNNNK
jgi:hypothetical protein